MGAFKPEDLKKLDETNGCQKYDLSNANLEKDYLKKANLEGVKLMEANLKVVHMRDADLEGANLG